MVEVCRMKALSLTQNEVVYPGTGSHEEDNERAGKNSKRKDL
jgi:hypothetical protein